MRIRLLGTAAGGGVPQWNCNCAVCRQARSGKGRVHSRTQSCVAISANGRRWWLLNASPDLRIQMEAIREQQPATERKRHSPVEGVLLTNADLDHTLGLLLMREGDELLVHAPTNIQQYLTVGLPLAAILHSYAGLRWIDPPIELAPLDNQDGSRSGLLYQALPLAGRPPRFSRAPLSEQGNVVGYRIIDERSGGRLMFLPAVAALDEKLSARLPECDVLLFDGTFWAEDEMSNAGVGTRTASAMGHTPISGHNGSLKVLAALPIKHKVYFHINNTNPILIEDSPERAEVHAAGCLVASDGMELIV